MAEERPDVGSAVPTGQAQGAGALQRQDKPSGQASSGLSRLPQLQPNLGRYLKGEQYKAAIALGNLMGHKNTKYSSLTMSLSQ